jgi:hypothetical protein
MWSSSLASSGRAAGATSESRFDADDRLPARTEVLPHAQASTQFTQCGRERYGLPFERRQSGTRNDVRRADESDCCRIDIAVHFHSDRLQLDRLRYQNECRYRQVLAGHFDGPTAGRVPDTLDRYEIWTGSGRVQKEEAVVAGFNPRQHRAVRAQQSHGGATDRLA